MSVRIFGGIRPLDPRRTLRDLLAGVNLATINVPQVLGYSRIAGMPVITGLYTLVLPPVAFALLGSSRHLVVAADSATAAIFAGSVGRLAVHGSEHYVSLVCMLALLTAMLLLVARVFKLGFLADFLSHTVLIGFLSGVGCQVGITMLGDMLGLEVSAGSSLVRIWQIAKGLPHLNVWTLSLSAVVTVIILVGKRFAPRWPLPLAAIVGTIWASSAYGFAERGIAVMGPVPAGLPPLKLPDVTWSELLALLPISAACFVTIIAQSAATARLFALRYRESEDVNADILGLAAANAAAAVTGAFVVNGSPTQTAIADRVGARSQIAQLVLSVAAVLVLVLLSGEIAYLPRCVLAAVVFTIALGMIDLEILRDIRRESPGEFQLAMVTAVTVVAVGVEQGILLAMALSLFRHVRHSYRPHTLMYESDANGHWQLVPAAPGKVTEPGLIVYRFGADLFYANESLFVDEVRKLVEQAPSPVRWFIVDAEAITDIDYSAARFIRELIGELAKHGVQLIFGRVTPYLRSDMERHGVTAALGAEHVCANLHEAIALARGKSDDPRSPDGT
ncbi:MAG TPA: SulP family inorganic anion transporter [Steroidobacteraceae bacterium]|nr:SulP family inorganic anion transporter [Steroidobacteraceae bacterium]